MLVLNCSTEASNLLLIAGETFLLLPSMESSFSDIDSSIYYGLLEVGKYGVRLSTIGIKFDSAGKKEM